MLSAVLSVLYGDRDAKMRPLRRHLELWPKVLRIRKLSCGNFRFHLLGSRPQTSAAEADRLPRLSGFNYATTILVGALMCKLAFWSSWVHHLNSKNDLRSRWQLARRPRGGRFTRVFLTPRR